MDVTALESVVRPPLCRAIVENSLVGQLRMRREECFHDQLFGPSSVKAHRADHHVLIDRHRRIASEKEIWKRG